MKRKKEHHRLHVLLINEKRGRKAMRKVICWTSETLHFTFSKEVVAIRKKNPAPKRQTKKTKTSKRGYLVSIHLKKGHIV